jgi:hypothetical protein
MPSGVFSAFHPDSRFSLASYGETYLLQSKIIFAPRDRLPAKSRNSDARLARPACLFPGPCPCSFSLSSPGEPRATVSSTAESIGARFCSSARCARTGHSSPEGVSAYPQSRSAVLQLIERARTNADIWPKGARMSFTAIGDVL